MVIPLQFLHLPEIMISTLDGQISQTNTESASFPHEGGHPNSRLGWPSGGYLGADSAAGGSI